MRKVQFQYVIGIDLRSAFVTQFSIYIEQDAPRSVKSLGRWKYATLSTSIIQLKKSLLVFPKKLILEVCSLPGS